MLVMRRNCYYISANMQNVSQMEFKVMYRKILVSLSIVLLLVSLALAEDPVVSNVVAHQLDFPSLMVEITYDVQASTETVQVTTIISDDNGETWDVPVITVEGDIGEGVAIGEGKRILWNAGEDFPDHDIEEMVVRIIANDLIIEPEAGTERDFELTDGVSITMVWIPRGSFMMGRQDNEQDSFDREDPRHEVHFDYGFWMGKYEVTQGQWEAVMGNNPSYDYGVGDNYPVYYVNWADIQEFESALDNVFRLPSESEWEYACRAGTDTRFYWGDDADHRQIGSNSWYGWNNQQRTTHPVGEKTANAFGLYDMSGHVWEWCEDRWHDNYNGAPDDGSPWLENPIGPYRVNRGGCNASRPMHCRSANRNHPEPSIRSRLIGFRLVRSN